MLGLEKPNVRRLTLLAGMLSAAAAPTMIGRHFAKAPTAPPEKPIYDEARADNIYSEENYAKATIRFTGQLPETVSTEIRQISRHNGRTLVFVVRDSDFAKCEDLGRQLRAAERSARQHGIRTLAVMPTPDIRHVAQRLRRERLSIPIVSWGVADYLLADSVLGVTPAAFIVSRTGWITDGVAHPFRFPNIRPRSFAEELAF